MPHTILTPPYMYVQDAPEGNPANFLSLQLGSTILNPSVWHGDARSKYIPYLRGGVPLPYNVHQESRGGERAGLFSTHVGNNLLPGAVLLNRSIKVHVTICERNHEPNHYYYYMYY